MRIKPFAAFRPPVKYTGEVTAPPYDVLNSNEAAKLAGEKSLLHITKPEIDLDSMSKEYDTEAYEKAVENFKLWKEKKWLVQDEKPCYYVYSQTMGERTQYGIVLCSHTDDYSEGLIKKHELTRQTKEDDRMRHILVQNANIEPVFFSYRDNSTINNIVSKVIVNEPESSLVDEHGFKHCFWTIDDDELIGLITSTFTNEVDAFYVADGHHRTAAAARVGAEKRKHNPHHTGNEEYNYFMAVCFPESQLEIIDYNRVVKDLNGHSAEEFLSLLSEDFEIREVEVSSDKDCEKETNKISNKMSKKDEKAVKPSKLHEFSMYLDGKWYMMNAKEGRYDDNDPIGVLDVTVLSNHVLDKLLNIKDLRTDERIDFVGGIRGLSELKERVDSGEMKVAFALYPVSMKQLTDIADSGKIMPPKTTWFEPKLRSGFTIHTLD